MWPTGSFERLKFDVTKEYDDKDIPITFGILVVDGRQTLAREYILNYLNQFDENSNKVFDFFIPGYYEDSYSEKDFLYLKRINKKYVFNTDMFEDFIKEIKIEFGILYTYNPMLILIEKLPNKPLATCNQKIIIELDTIKGSLNRSGILFDKIFDIARSEVNIKRISNQLVNTTIRGGLIKTIINLLNNKYIVEIYNQQQEIKKFKIK